jgi:hypothetical protein
VDDWAPVLGGIWVESEDATEYALGEAAQAAYEAELAAEGVLRRRWELTVEASDRNVTRSGAADAKTGRQAITALWDAWELGTEVNFKDVDHDADPVTYLVSIAGIEEKAAKPSDSARWGESTVSLVLEEGESLGAAAGGVHVHSLPDLDDVTLAALADGHVLTWDSGTGQWVNEPVRAGAHDHDSLYYTEAEVNTLLAGKANTGHSHAAGDVTSGQFAMARLASGSLDGTKFIRDDGVLATPAGGGGSGAVFVATAPETITGVNVLTDFTTQRHTIPANNATVGKVYRLTARGLVSNSAGGTRTVDSHIRLGGVTIASSGATNIAAGASNLPWEVQFDLVVITTGAGGTAEAQGTRFHNTTTDGMSNAATVAFDTTVAKTLGLAVTPSATAVTVVQRQLIVQAL